MQVNYNPVINNIKTIASFGNKQHQNKFISDVLEPFKVSKDAVIPPFQVMKGIDPNQNSVFDTFSKIDDVTRSINFVRSQEAWDDCFLEEMEEFTVARREYQENPTQQNYDHMAEEMGDLFYTAASIAKDSGIDPEKAFKTTNLKFYNRINLMERMLNAGSTGEIKGLQDCRDWERRALWNSAKRKIYDAQALNYQA